MSEVIDPGARDLLSKEQVQRVRRIRELQADDPDAPASEREIQEEFARLFASVRGLVRSIVKRCLGRRSTTTLTVDDLESESMLVLYKAVEGFDEAKGDFAGYFAVGVARRVQAVLRNDRLIHGSDALQQELWEAQQDFFKRTGRDPSDAELVEEYGFTQQSLDDIRRANRIVRGSTSSEEGEASFESSFEGRREDSPDFVPELADDIRVIVEGLRFLDKDAAQIVRARLGIEEDGTLTGEGMSWREIATLIGESTAWVKDLYKRGIARLQEAMEPARHPPADPSRNAAVPPLPASPIPVSPENVGSPEPAVILPVPSFHGAAPERGSQEPMEPPLRKRVGLVPESVLPPERTDYGMHMPRVLTHVTTAIGRRILEVLREKPNMPVKLEQICDRIWGEATPSRMLSAQRYIAWIQEDIAGHLQDVGIIQPVRGEKSYQLTTRSWKELSDIQHLAWQERQLLELLAEWERHPIRIGDVQRRLPQVASGKKDGITSLMYDLRKKGIPIVSIGDHYLYNSATNIPADLMAKLKYHEYVLLAKMLQAGVGVPVSRSDLLQTFGHAHDQIDTKPARDDKMPQMLRSLRERLAGHGSFDTQIVKRSGGIVDCTLREWAYPLRGPEPAPVISMHEANVRRFAAHMARCVYAYASASELERYFPGENISLLERESPPFLPPGTRIMHTPQQGWSLVRQSA